MFDMSNNEDLEYLLKNSRSCFVYGCFSTAANKPYLGFHKIPNKGERNIVVSKKNGDNCIYDRRQLWIEALDIGREASLAIDGLNVYICSLHFSRDDFYYNQDITGKRYLKELAIPRRNLPARKTSQLSTKFNIRSLNRVKYRGYFNIHNPDGRKLTAPRRFLGETNFKDVPGGQSYTKTVWVVRKPIPNASLSEQNYPSKDDLSAVSVSHPFSLVDISEGECATEEMEDDVQCTILETENPPHNTNPWFTSELIIKEEPISDSEQVTYGTANDDEEDEDNNYEPSKLVIETETDEQSKLKKPEELNGRDRYEVEYEATNVQDLRLSEIEELDPTEVEYLDLNEGEDFSLSEVEVLEPSQLKEVEPCEVEEFDSNEEDELEQNEIEELEQNEMEELGQNEIDVLEQNDLDIESLDIEQFKSVKSEELSSRTEFEEDDWDIVKDYTNHEQPLDAIDNIKDLDCDVTVVHVDDPNENHYSNTGIYEKLSCGICGFEDCEGHPKTRPKENMFVCLICSEIFPSQKQLALHSIYHQEISDEEMVMLEERTKSLTCEFCGRVLSTKATLREHIMIHTGEKPHQCILCGKSFRHKANLVVHVNGHAVISTYKCKKCNKAFTKKMDFEKHLKFHVDASGNPLVCKICNAVFKSQRTLYNHSQLHSRKGLVRAKKRNNGPTDPVHVCKTCGRVLSTKATLKEHMMIHSGEKPHECPICGRTIRHKANYVVHIQTHGQGKSYECDMCDEAFMKKSDLTQHKQVLHSKSKLLRCPICSEVFKSPMKFNRHMEIHESVVYMNETEELSGFQPHLLESFLEA